MKTALVLDYDKWVCGKGESDWIERDGIHSLGLGITYLENEHGFQCCLGQFICQISPDLKPFLLKKGNPNELKEEIPILTASKKTIYDTTVIDNSSFSGNAIEINDDTSTTITEKISLLKELCELNECELVVINL